MKTYRILPLLLLMCTSVMAQDSGKIQTLYTGLQNARSLSITQQEVFIVEQGLDRILRLDHEGRLLDSFGTTGSGDYQLDQPLDIDATNGLRIYISDTRNNRIQVFDKRWQLLSSIDRIPAQTNRRLKPGWLGVNTLGELIFYDQDEKDLIRLNENGTFQDRIPLASEIMDVSELKLNQSSMYILDKKASVIHQLTEGGFYDTFYPAKKVVSFTFSNGELWLAKADRVTNLDAEYLFKGEDRIRDIHAYRGQIYILTENRLIRLTHD